MAAQSNAAQTFVCALTGQSPLSDPVVTPSGHVCSRKFLLTKLAENGGVDPFDAAGTRGLEESMLVELSTKGSVGSAAPPRPPKATSLPALLGMLQNEFDAVLLELYDTRKALEETRRELSSALYQNDAAVRVVARLAKERDEARGRLEEFLSADAAQRATAAPEKRGRDDAAAMEAEEPAKKARVEEEEEHTDLTKIPPADLTAMSKTWKSLSKGRKAIAKAKRTDEETAANEALLGALSEGGEKKVNLGKSSAKAGVLCMTSVKSGDVEYVVTGSHDKTAIVYNVTSGQMAATLSGAGGDVTVVHAMAMEGALLVATGSADGSVRLYSVPTSGDSEPSLLGSAGLSNAQPVDVVVHPSSTADEARIIVAASNGSIQLYKNSGGEELKLLTHLASEEGTEFASGCIHPDGFIYIAGTTDGRLVVWDLKTQAVAGKLEGHDGKPVQCVAVSENGYHVASSSSDSVSTWDLRKLKAMASFAPADVGAVTSLAFDPSATYLAYSGEEATKVCVVKDSEKVVCTLTPSKTGKKKAGAMGGGVAWGGKGFGKDGEEGKVWLATGCDGQRPVRFWGVE